MTHLQQKTQLVDGFFAVFLGKVLLLTFALMFAILVTDCKEAEYAFF